MHWIFTLRPLVAIPAAGLWLAGEQTASAQTLLAQTGTAKTAIGWGVVLLCIGLGLLFVCRPNNRNPLEKKKAKKKK
ncbi:MAG TPA: hypothetical protein VGI40_13195 [Pirellulaceae bacterium]|jgi:hypothetical protein